MRQWYYGENDRQIGPVSQELLVDLIKTGKLTADTYIWTDGMPEWGLVSKSPFAKLITKKTASEPIQKSEVAPKRVEQISRTQKPANANLSGAISSFEPEPPIESATLGEDIPVATKTEERPLEEVGNISTGPLRSYKHSGTCPVNAYFLVPLLGFLSLFVLAPIYAYAIKYIPFVYIDFILIGGYGFALGMIVHYSAKVLKMRNDIIVMSIGAVVGLAGLYAGWVFWIHAFIGKIIISPFTLMKLIPIIAEKGTWGIKGTTVTGIVLYILWLIEAGAIIGIAAFSSKIKTPFCERCDEWAETEYQIPPLEKKISVKNVASSLKQGDFAPLMSLKKLYVGDHLLAKINFCSSCRKLYVMSLIDVVFKIEKEDKEPKREETVVAENLIINEDQFRMLQKHWK